MATVDSSLINAAKLSLRITTNAFDSQITDLLNTAFLDLGIAGVVLPPEYDELVKLASITFVMLHFGEPDNYDRLKAAYDEQKGQLAIATGYTNWGAINGQE